MAAPWILAWPGRRVARSGESTTPASRRPARSLGWLGACLVAGVAIQAAFAGPALSAPARLAHSARISGGWLDPHSGWPRWTVSDHPLRLEYGRARGVVEMSEFELLVDASSWRSSRARPPGAILIGTVGHRHVLVTDHTAWDQPITPWLDGGAGIGHAARRRGPLFGQGSRQFVALRLGFGCDAWVNPRGALFASYDRLWRKPMLFRSRGTESESSIRFGIAWWLVDAGRGR